MKVFFNTRAAKLTIKHVLQGAPVPTYGHHNRLTKYSVDGKGRFVARVNRLAGSLP